MWSSGVHSSPSLPLNTNPNNNNNKSMEEVWNDITLSSLHPPRATTFRPSNLQDFLAKPFSSPSKTPSPPPLPATSISLVSVIPDPLPLPEKNQRSHLEAFRNTGDRRFKRMIKNRESAARSRARKQAYTNELEQEVAHLLEENARLKRQQEQLCVAVAVQPPKKKSLKRSSTAPF